MRDAAINEDPRSQAKPGRPRRRKGLLLALAFGLVLVLVYVDYRRFLDAPLSVPAQGLILEIKPGTGVNHLAQQLQPSLSRPAFYLEAYTRLNGLASRLKAGEYALTPGLTSRTLLDRIVAGQVIQYPLTIVEGWTFR